MIICILNISLMAEIARSNNLKELLERIFYFTKLNGFTVTVFCETAMNIEGSMTMSKVRTAQTAMIII